MKKTLLQELSYWSGVLIVGLAIGLGIQFVRAWVEPAAEAPGGNLGAPINTGNIGQYKTGNLAVNTGGTWVNGLLVPNGNVGIGTNAPTQKLDVAGQIHASGDVCTDAGGGKCLSKTGTIKQKTVSCLYGGGNSSPASCRAECPSGYVLTGGSAENQYANGVSSGNAWLCSVDDPQNWLYLNCTAICISL